MSNFFVQNGFVGDLYIGKSAGKHLLRDIEHTQKEIKIVSPYVSPSLVKQLKFLASQGVRVTLVTRDDCSRNISEVVRTAVGQTATVIPEIVNKKNRVNKINQVNKIISSILIVLPAILLYLLAIFSFYWWYCLLFLPVLYGIISIICYDSHCKKVMLLNSYQYSYYPNFNFYVLPSRHGSIYLHSKIYCIDDRVAYVGSLNFTTYGTQSNYETSIKIESSETVKAISENIDSLVRDNINSCYSIESLGRAHYELRGYPNK